MCVDQCKCEGCANRAGSQKLIDKRRKMKDTKGAEYAMKISKEVWEQQQRVASIPIKPPMISSREVVVNRPVVQHRTGAAGITSRLNTTRPVQLGLSTIGNVVFSPMDHAKVDKGDGTSRVETAPPMTTPTVPEISTVPSNIIPNKQPSESASNHIEIGRAHV